MALLIDESQAAAEDGSLVETVTANRAIDARLSNDRYEAIACLNE